MSRESSRKGYFSRDPRNRDRERDRDRDRDWNRPPDYRSRPPVSRKSRSPVRNDINKRRSHSPQRKSDKDLIDDNILSEISKLPEPSELWDNQFQESGFSVAPPPPSFSSEVHIYNFNSSILYFVLVKDVIITNKHLHFLV